MHLNILALDLDGTLAENDKVAPATWEVLRMGKSKGLHFILVTGRRLNELMKIGPFEEIFEAIVAENGAVVHFVASDTITLPFGTIDLDLIQQIEAEKIPIDRGLAIAATWKPYDKAIIKILTQTGFPASLEYNRDAVMLLPLGATKGTGLITALQELGYSPHNVLACGDAENDKSLFVQAEYAVAVANANSQLKAIADKVLSLPNGAGICQLIEDLIQQKLTSFPSGSKHIITLGKQNGHHPFQLNTFNLIDYNLGIFGASGTGKSWLSGLLAEALLIKEYQICLIDPEGEYRNIKKLPHTLLLGGSNIPPSLEDVATLMEYSTLSIILDLSLYSHEQKIVYTEGLLHLFSCLRISRGRPHWVLIDEAHYFCPTDKSPLTPILEKFMSSGGLSLVSYRPSQIAPRLLKKLDHLFLTRIKSPVDLDAIRSSLPDGFFTESLLNDLTILNNKQAHFYTKHLAQADRLIEFDNVTRRVPHVRHLHKYLLAPLPRDKRFYFKVDDPKKKEKIAANLHEFSEILPQLSASTLKYHLDRGDFEKWIRTTLHDQELARLIKKIANRHLDEESLKDILVETVNARFAELQTLL